MEDVIRGFGLNVSVLLSLTLVFFLFSEHIARNIDQPAAGSLKRREIGYGLLLGVIGFLVMATPVEIGNGVVFDARTILLGLAAAFFGWLPAVIAAGACAAFRIYQGGAGTVPGVLTMLIALCCGLIWRHWRGKDLSKPRFVELLGLGLVIHIFVILILLGLLPAIREAILQQIAPIFLLLYPLIFAALGLLMQHRFRLEIERRRFLKSRERYRNLFLNNHLPIFLVDPQDGLIVDVNPAAESFYGWTRQELLQMHASEIDTLDPAELTRLMLQARQAEVNEFEVQHRLRDGSLREVLVRSGPVEIEGRQLLYAIIADQSESKRLLAALQESEAQAREFVSAVEQCRVSIVFTDTEGRIEYVNPYFCELTGYSAGELIGENPKLLSSGMQSRHFYREMWQTIAAGQVWEGEFCNRRKDGSTYWESAVIAPVTDAQGAIIKYVAAKHNITSLKEHEQAMEQALRAAQAGMEAKASFLSVISHELRTPLNHIIGPCELVAEDLPAGASKALLENAIQAGHHLAELVQRIIRFSELSGPSESQLRVIEDPEKWLHWALQPYAELAHEKATTLEASVSKDFPEVFTADETALSEILSVLLNNAFEYATPGTIRVELSAELPNARLAVIDPGPVISEAQKKRLFQPFQQLDMSHTREHAGIGLGLCLARRYAERCGGSIQLTADPGGGNCFEFVFPVTTASDQARLSGTFRQA